ncbi:MAG: DUF354 domain-containing protein [Thaumarchaeota archaeon]|nr:DUF354 domain-containing protein [Nitrososphaerota archaeon]
MVRLWIDSLTPKQVLFTKAIVERAPSKVKCTVTTRDYSELNQFVSQTGLANKRVGRHGGGDIKKKLSASIDRQKLLIPFATEHDFDFSLSFLSPEAARVSFGLGVPHYLCSDSPHAYIPSRLCVPLSTCMYTPFPIKKQRWTQYGIKPNQVKMYHALDPWAWLQSQKVKTESKVTGRVMIRLEERLASYFEKGKGVSDTLSELIDAIRGISDFEIMLIPRYDDQREWAKRKYGKVCNVPLTTIDGAKAIGRTDLLIGGGGTMTQEAALLGIPNISYFPSADLDVFSNYYFPKKLSIKASSPTQLIKSTCSILRKIDSVKPDFLERAKPENSKFEDPIKFIFENLFE